MLSKSEIFFCPQTTDSALVHCFIGALASFYFIILAQVLHTALWSTSKVTYQVANCKSVLAKKFLLFIFLLQFCGRRKRKDPKRKYTLSIVKKTGVPPVKIVNGNNNDNYEELDAYSEKPSFTSSISLNVRPSSGDIGVTNPVYEMNNMPGTPTTLQPVTTLRVVRSFVKRKHMQNHL